MNLNYSVVIIFNLCLSVYCLPLPEDASIQIDEESVAASIAQEVDSASAASGTISIEKAIEVVSPIQKPPIHRETAKLETEGIPSKVLAVYDNSQNKVGDFFNPKPIVDTIQEHEKYGNTGDKFYPVGRAIVNGYEGFSNFLNKLLDSPVNIAKQVSQGITNQLNTVGAKIVGLA